MTNISVDDLLSLSFPLSEAVDFMETGKTFYLLSPQQECPQPEQTPVPITQDMDFYFNIVTVINFLTSVINAIIISICYKKRKDLLAGILTVQEDWIGTRVVSYCSLGLLPSSSIYTSIWCHRKSWSRHQKLQEDWIGTRVVSYCSLGLLPSSSIYTSIWCHRKSWSRHQKLQEEEGTSIISMSLYLDS